MLFDKEGGTDDDLMLLEDFAVLSSISLPRVIEEVPVFDFLDLILFVDNVDEVDKYFVNVGAVDRTWDFTVLITNSMYYSLSIQNAF